MRYLFIFWMLTMYVSSCSTKESTISLDDAVILNTEKDYNALITDFDEEVLLRSTEQPNDSGALGRNKHGYFHVRFQLNMSKLSDLAVRSQRKDALQAFFKTLEYSFLHQKPEGDFELILPAELANNPGIPPPNAGDKTSGVAFFAYSLGLGLTTLENSEWYQNHPETEQIRLQIQALDSKVKMTLAYLKANVDILNQVDHDAPNRLLFDAIAFYSLGSYLEDDGAMETGLDFLNSALELVDDTTGYFVEGGGWDSSYNGVALKLGLETFTLLPPLEIKERLGKKLVNAMKWQVSRILPSGEISTEGNTRVFPGGESFLGNEKAVDVEKKIKALLYFSVLTANDSYGDLAFQVLDFYE